MNKIWKLIWSENTWEGKIWFGLLILMASAIIFITIKGLSST